jgi:hypothetical protein
MRSVHVIYSVGIIVYVSVKLPKRVSNLLFSSGFCIIGRASVWPLQAFHKCCKSTGSARSLPNPSSGESVELRTHRQRERHRAFPSFGWFSIRSTRFWHAILASWSKTVIPVAPFEVQTKRNPKRKRIAPTSVGLPFPCRIC